MTAGTSKGRTIAVGVTGGIGSGKSEVCSVFRRLGARVIQSDDLARTIMSDDPAIRKKISLLLGPDAVRGDRKIDRTYVARKIFRSSVLRRRLNAIVHPAVISSIRKTIRDEKRRRRLSVLAVESALIHQAGISGLFDAVVVVSSPQTTRIERLRSRDGITAAEARRRIASQKTGKGSPGRGDIIIVNRGDRKALRAASRLVFGVLSGIASTGGVR